MLVAWKTQIVMHMKEYEHRYVAIIERHTLDGANTTYFHVFIVTPLQKYRSNVKKINIDETSGIGTSLIISNCYFKACLW